MVQFSRRQQCIPAGLVVPCVRPGGRTRVRPTLTLWGLAVQRVSSRRFGRTDDLICVARHSPAAAPRSIHDHDAVMQRAGARDETVILTGRRRARVRPAANGRRRRAGHRKARRSQLIRSGRRARAAPN
jgi:hypothetical protein